MDIMEYVSEFDGVLGEAVEKAVGGGFISRYKIELLYDIHDRVKAASVAHALKMEPDTAAAIFATFEAYKVEKTTGSMSKLFSGKAREKISELQKVRGLFAAFLLTIPLDLQEKYITAVSQLIDG